jgi:predicted nucleotidyltransferase
VSDNQCGSTAPAEDNHKVSSSAAHIESIGDVDSWSQFQLLSGQSPPATLVEADQLSTFHFTTISDNTPQQLEAAGDVDSWSHFSTVNDQVRPKTPIRINQICQLDGMDHLFGRAIINSEVAGDVDSWSQFICEN